MNQIPSIPLSFTEHTVYFNCVFVIIVVLGYLLNALEWCGSSEGINYNECPEWTDCETSAKRSFWNAASKTVGHHKCLSLISFDLNMFIYNSRLQSTHKKYNSLAVEYMKTYSNLIIININI